MVWYIESEDEDEDGDEEDELTIERKTPLEGVLWGCVM